MRRGRKEDARVVISALRDLPLDAKEVDDGLQDIVQAVELERSLRAEASLLIFNRVSELNFREKSGRTSSGGRTTRSGHGAVFCSLSGSSLCSLSLVPLSFRTVCALLLST